jgi:hypothetical protein
VIVTETGAENLTAAVPGDVEAPYRSFDSAGVNSVPVETHRGSRSAHDRAARGTARLGQVGIGHSG